jgi:hypothetical protein
MAFVRENLFSKKLLKNYIEQERLINRAKATMLTSVPNDTFPSHRPSHTTGSSVELRPGRHPATLAPS